MMKVLLFLKGHLNLNTLKWDYCRATVFLLSLYTEYTVRILFLLFELLNKSNLKTLGCVSPMDLYRTVGSLWKFDFG